MYSKLADKLSFLGVRQGVWAGTGAYPTPLMGAPLYQLLRKVSLDFNMRFVVIGYQRP